MDVKTKRKRRDFAVLKAETTNALTQKREEERPYVVSWSSVTAPHNNVEENSLTRAKFDTVIYAHAQLNRSRG
jgi:hypothetical protein